MGGGIQNNKKLIADINITPLVDIILVLLLVFIVTTKVVSTSSIPMDLPKASLAGDVQVVFSVILKDEKSIEVNGNTLKSEQNLTLLAAESLKKNTEPRVVIHASGQVSHARVIKILNLLKEVGFEKIAFGAFPE